MSIKSQTLDESNVVILEPKGSLIGGMETEELKTTLMKLMEQGTVKVIVDLAGVEYLNSSAIGVLTVSHTTLMSHGGKLILCNVNKSISNIFLVTKLSTIFRSEDKRE
ncbi:MAG: STAS domain-containing protein, partial [Bacteriovoracaceae bacterium]